MNRKVNAYIFAVFILVFMSVVLNRRAIQEFQRNELSGELIFADVYREQNIGEEMLCSIMDEKNVGESVAVYLLQEKYGYESWKKDDGWKIFLEYTKAIWNDVKYFPVPQFPLESTLKTSYVNSWMSERTYGGKRGHEGTDIMASRNERGIYPIVSMTDGTVTQKGWLEKGGYRIGVMTSKGVYFYYAHLASYANVEIGDEIKAGDVLGYMGDSGYGKEGTIGQFAVHLHLGIYIYPNGKETSVNPYWVLRYIENHRVKCYTNM